MTIAKRLMLLLAMSILSLSLVVGINIQQMGHLYESSMYSSENITPSILLLDKLKATFANGIRVRAYRHVLTTDPKSMAEIEKSWNDAVDKMNAGLKDYEKLISNDEDRRLLEEEKRLFTAYIEKLRTVIEHSSQNRNDEAFKGLNEHAPLARQVTEALDKHMTFNEKLEEEAIKEAAATRQRALLVSIAIAIASLLVVVGIVVLTRKAILSQLAEANQLAARVAAGDLSQHNLTLSNDEIGAMMRSLEKMRGDLAQTVAQIMQSTHALAESSGHLATAAHQVSTSSENQSSATSAAAAAVEELTVSIDHVGSSADDANARAEEAGEAAVNSGQNVSQASNQIGRVAESVEDTSGRIRSLADQVQLIGNITTVIREVADQTNLLALNAAIEAARAGEQGRGFAVVADEVRKLAERTTLSVQEISTLISSIQAGVSGAEQSMEASRQIVTEVVTVAETASSSMGHIESATGTAREAIAGISYALREQRSTSTELAKNVESIAQMSEENSAAAGAVSDTAQQLVRVADTLKSAVSRFRV